MVKKIFCLHIQTIQHCISPKIISFTVFKTFHAQKWKGLRNLFSLLSSDPSSLSPSSVLLHFHSQNSRRENQTKNHVVLLSLLSYSILDPRNQEAIESFCFNCPPCSNFSSHFVYPKLCFLKSLLLCLNVCVYLQTFLCPCSFIQVILQNVFSFLTGFNHFCNKHVLQHNSQP